MAGELVDLLVFGQSLINVAQLLEAVLNEHGDPIANKDNAKVLCSTRQRNAVVGKFEE